MKSIDEMSESEIEKLAHAIIHQAVEESKLCSIPVTENKIKFENGSIINLSNAKSDNNRKIIGQKNVVTHWIH